MTVTREQVLAMEPGRELDALVAELVMDYRRETVPKDANGEHGGTEVRVPPNVDHDTWVYPPRGPVPLWYFVPRYSTSRDDAWRIIGIVRGQQFSRRLSFTNALRQVINGRMGAPVDPVEWLLVAEPADICKAALLATLESEAAS